MTTRWRVVLVALMLALPGTSSLSQTAARRLTTIDALRRFPGYYHLQNVLLRGEFVDGPRVQLRADERLIDAALDDGVRTTNGPVEVRAQLVDVGRLEPGDQRLAALGIPSDRSPWPKPGEELVLKIGNVAAAAAGTLTIRALALEPWRYEGQKVTLVGQFRGRNLFGDLPGAPAKSRYDFVLKSGDGAIWVTGVRPRGKGFDLSVDARVDTNRWLEVSGIVRRERSLVTIEGATLTASTARTEAVPEEVAPAPPPPAPVEAIFSTPTTDDTDVPTGAPVRVQFSRGLNPTSVARGFVVSYANEAATPIAFRATYDAATQGVEIRFSEPLTPFSRVRIATAESLRGFDGAPITPWTITFTTGS